MKKLIITVFSLLLTGATALPRQGGEELRLTLSEAQDYALTNNKMVQAAKSDVMASRMAVWETISSALPQINATGSFNDNLKLMTSLLPGEIFGQPGIKIPLQFGSQYNSSGSVQASLLIFNAPLYIGIETTKMANRLSEQNLEKSELDTRESVALAYYLILVSERSLDILNGNIANLNETLASTRAMFSAGMAEATDVDQMVSNLSMVENSKSTLERTIELNYNLLRFQLGVEAGTAITLTETLDGFAGQVNIEAILSQEFDHTKNVNYRLIEGQEKMSELALKSQKASILPTLSGFYNYGTNGMGDKVSELDWFQNSMAGLQLQVPLIAGGQRYAKIKKAQYNLEKVRTTREMVSEQLLLQEKQLRYNLINANLQYRSQKDNVEVSKRIYESMENKFRQGMASSLELTQANSQFLQAENNYISALMNLLQTKLALDKLLNNI